MIATCPGCETRYRLAPEKIGPRGARIRCKKCSEVFKVHPPDEPPVADVIEEVEFVARALVAEADADTAKAVCAYLETWAIEGVVVVDGAQALLEMHRKRPDLAILGARLPGMSSPAIAEVLRRNPDLQEVPLVRIVGPGETAIAPEFDADHTLEPGDLPSGLGAALRAMGVGASPGASGSAAVVSPSPGPAAPVAAPAPAAAPPAPARRAARSPSGSDDPEIRAAERLARIVVSDIVLYNEEKFATAARQGNVAEALSPELEEAGSMFRERVSEELRAQRDFLVEELERRAQKHLENS